VHFVGNATSYIHRTCQGFEETNQNSLDSREYDSDLFSRVS